MHFKEKLIKLWAYLGIAVVLAVILFLFGYVFIQGYQAISWEFITDVPKGAILGHEGGIWPAIVGSLYFTTTATVLGSIPAVATAIYLVFFCRNKKISTFIHLVLQCITGIPSIVLGLFSYSFLVRSLGLGRCILAGGIALAIMILPFIEVRIEKSLRELPLTGIYASYSLGCSKFYTFYKIILPACRHEFVSGILLGGCFAMGATAPIIFTGGVAYATVPHSLTEPAMALPLHLYLLLAQGTSMPQVYGTAFILMAIVLSVNLLAIYYSRRRKKHKWNQS